jgi:hypothetical protein
MKESWATSGKNNEKARPDFLDASRFDVSLCLEGEMRMIPFLQGPGTEREDEEQVAAS